MSRSAGVLTTRLGALEAGRKGFVQDGIGRDRASGSTRRSSTRIPAGTIVVIPGTLASYFSLRVLAADGARSELPASACSPMPWPQRPARRASRSKAFALTVSGTVTSAPARWPMASG